MKKETHLHLRLNAHSHGSMNQIKQELKNYIGYTVLRPQKQWFHPVFQFGFSI